MHYGSRPDCLPERPATMHLTPTEARVLGALIEKEITTPEYYPLSLNALVNACNQKNNRDPVTALDEVEVRQALHGLETERLAGAVRGDTRVAKYEHHVQEVFNFTRGEIAVMCVLLLRGPQTPGELRGRTERMYKFDELSDVQTVLQRLAGREPDPLVKILPRQPGTKEARYAHLLSGEVEGFEPAASRYAEASSHAYAATSSAAGHFTREENEELKERMAQLEAEVAILTRELSELRAEFARLSTLLE
jgi:uncharacterized protein YceH (UPF0502 family)